jgi:hypothetical protein
MGCGLCCLLLVVVSFRRLDFDYIREREERGGLLGGEMLRRDEDGSAYQRFEMVSGISCNCSDGWRYRLISRWISQKTTWDPDWLFLFNSMS